MTVRTRFAPSPTGRLHVGNVRVAVFNWLFTRHHGGSFVLRIEDTDPERNEPGAEEGIMEDLRWLGLDWDEGPAVGGPHGPYRQSERMHLYGDAARALVEKELAYPCYCTEEELVAASEELSGGDEVLRYSGRCRDLSEEECRTREQEGREPVIRFKAPGSGVIEVEDEVRGRIAFPANDIHDFIILRRDRRPTYNFAVALDDALMEITHVIRGAGHISNTPKQVLLLDALGQDRPRFAHLPTVLAPEGGKLSKRRGAAAVSELREAGYPPEAVVNYLSLLGWSHPEEKEVLGRQQLVETVDLDRVGPSDTAFDPAKLQWISSQHLAAMATTELAKAVAPFMDRDRFPLESARLEPAVAVLRSRLDTFSDINRHLHFLFPGDALLAEAWSELAEDRAARNVLLNVQEVLRAVDRWDADTLDTAVREGGKAAGVRGPALFHPVRRALTGTTSGPELGGILEALGPEESLKRLARPLERV